ncbi:glycosyltransferase, partial [Pluralibacter gergoviae]
FIINYPHWELHILGDGEERLELQRKIEKLQLNDRVFLQGKVRNIEDYYIDADVCLMTSLYEGLPMALLEAKSYSLPVIAYDCPTGPKEIIENGNDGYVIDMHDSKEFLNKLTYIATNDQAYFEFTRNTQKTCARFQSENIKNKWIKLIYR